MTKNKRETLANDVKVLENEIEELEKENIKETERHPCFSNALVINCVYRLAFR